MQQDLAAAPRKGTQAPAALSHKRTCPRAQHLQRSSKATLANLFFFFFCSAISILHGACSRATHVHSLPVLCPVAAPSQGTRGVLLHPLVEQCARSLWGFSIHCLFIKKKPFCLPKRSCLLACCALGQLDPSQSVMQPSGKLHPPTAQLFPLKQPRALPLARRSCLGRAKWVKEPSR